MANKVIRSNMTEEELKHYGVIGMKWGQHKAKFKTNRTQRRVRIISKRFDRGWQPDTTSASRRVRRQKFKIEKGIKRTQRFLKRAKKADAENIINRFNKNPNKRVAVEKYMKELQTYSTTLTELRMQLIDIRL